MRDLSIALGLRHLDEIGERATAPDHHFGRERRLPDRLLDGPIDAAAQRLPVLRLERVRLAVPLGEPDRAQRQRDDLVHYARGVEDDFRAASPDFLDPPDLTD